MEPGTFAVDPEPWGPPWRRWEELSPGEAEARGIYAPVRALSEGEPGATVIAPGNVRGTRLTPGKSGGACCGLDGRDGPNMACLACGLPVASRIDDCSLWQAVWLAPRSVRRVPVGDADAALLTWEELLEEGKSTPPFEPIATVCRRRRLPRSGRNGTGDRLAGDHKAACATDGPRRLASRRAEPCCRGGDGRRPGGGARAAAGAGGRRRAGRYCLLPATRAGFLRRLGRNEEAASAYEEALALAGAGPERRFLTARLAEVRSRHT
jgi:hypothetical protein